MMPRKYFTPEQLKESAKKRKAKYLSTAKGKKNTKESRAKYYEQNKGYERDLRLKLRCGISLDEWNKMFGEQQGCCAICGKHQSEEKRNFAVDHDHETDIIRGLLCSNCNTKLGWLEARLDTIFEYIERGKL